MGFIDIIPKLRWQKPLYISSPKVVKKHLELLPAYSPYKQVPKLIESTLYLDGSNLLNGLDNIQLIRQLWSLYS